MLKTTISDLRATLQDEPRRRRYIETVLRRGYRFIVVISDAAAAEVAPRPSESSAPSLVCSR